MGALVSGGSPTVQYPDGCTTGQAYFNSGLWIFSRAPVLAPGKLAEAKQVLVDMGYTLSQLKKVRQEGCTYNGARIKPAAGSEAIHAVPGGAASPAFRPCGVRACDLVCAGAAGHELPARRFAPVCCGHLRRRWHL